MPEKIAVVTTSSFVAVAVLLPLLTGCVEHDEPRYRNEPRPPAAQIVVVDDYDYYPSYGIYYSRNRHEYIYLDGNRWVRTSAPRGVTTKVLFASPQVRMDFHDSPEYHHPNVVHSYPKNWGRPDNSHHDKDDHPGNERGNGDKRS